jgi:HPt (histidine-containing phosphotransfer) domain-containing protein
MINSNNTDQSAGGVCDLGYLSEMLGARKPQIRGIMDTFLEQIPTELEAMDRAVEDADYQAVKRLAHSMKSSVSILGISSLAPVLSEMESLGLAGTSLERLRELHITLKDICALAIAELENVKNDYV